MAIQFFPAPVAESPVEPQPPTLVLFGRNRSGKPCAAWFDGKHGGEVQNLGITAGVVAQPFHQLAGCDLNVPRTHWGTLLPALALSHSLDPVAVPPAQHRSE